MVSGSDKKESRSVSRGVSEAREVARTEIRAGRGTWSDRAGAWSGRPATEQNKLEVMRVSPSCVGCTRAAEQRSALDLELACTPIAQRNIASRKKKFTREEEEEEEEEEEQHEQQ